MAGAEQDLDWVLVMDRHRLALFQEMPIFGGVEVETLLYLLDLAERSHFEKNEFLCKEGASGSSIHVIEKGEVAVLKSFRGQDYLLTRLGGGSCVGEMALLDMGKRSASVVALTSCEAMTLSTSAFYQLRKKNLEQYTLIQLNMAREVCRRLRDTEQQLFETRMEADMIDGEYCFHV